MTRMAPGPSVLRARVEGEDRVQPIELFFDLVYVFAVTQLSHLLLDSLTLRGAAETLVLLLAVWWAWVYTSWFTNWFDPNQLSARLLLVAVMGASLVMSAAIPDAFGDGGWQFAGAYVAIQVGRTGWASLALGGRHELTPNLRRVTAWAAFSGVVWLAGAAASGDARLVLWALAAAIDYGAPAVGFVTPGLGRSTTADWTIAGGHLAERCQLFVIIALGESVLLTGATYSALPRALETTVAVAVAFLGSVGLWWVYFDRGASTGLRAIVESADPGRLAAGAYTRIHVVMVAGIIGVAAADEAVIAHPDAAVEVETAAVILGGPLVYLLGTALYQRALGGALPVARLAAAAALCALAPIALVSSLLLLSALTLVVIAGVAIADLASSNR
jgi:low temperature requirement protein LtrA